MTTFRIPMKATDLPREVHDRANVLMNAALAEAGHPTESYWGGDRYYNVTPVPAHVLQKAGRLVCDHLGIPYEEVDA